MERFTITIRNRINAWDWLLVIGLVLAPITRLRIWKVGPAELLCAIWSIKYLNIRSIVLSDVMKFFVGLIVCFSIGTLIGLYTKPAETGYMGVLTWVYLGYIASMIYHVFSRKGIRYAESALYLYAVTAACLYAFFYLYSVTVSRSFMGLNLWYSNKRFSAGGANPHQVAVALCGLSMYFMRRVIMERGKMLALILFAVCIFVELQTQSSTGVVAIVGGLVTMLFIYTANIGTSAKVKVSLLIMEAALVILACLIFYEKLYQQVYEWIASDANGLGRLTLFSSFSEAFKTSPIFGIGIGIHATTASDRAMEFHNTYLEVMISGGIAAMLVMVVFTVRMIRNCLKDPFFIPMVVALYAYGLGGYAMRRLPYWGMVTFAFVIAEMKRKEALTYATEGDDPDDEDDSSGEEDEFGQVY